MNQEKTAGTVIDIIVAGEQKTIHKIRSVFSDSSFQKRKHITCRTGSLDSPEQIKGIFNPVMYLFHYCPDITVIVPGKKHQDGGTKPGGQNQRCVGAYIFHTAPEAANQPAGRNQLIPVIERRASAEEHSPHKQVMFLHGKQGCFRPKGMQNAIPEFFHCMQNRMMRPVSRFSVLFRIEGDIIQFFRIQITAFSFKKTMGRKACEILLAGLQLICPQNTHGFVSPLEGAGVGLPHH